jgi:hypothetical protein
MFLQSDMNFFVFVSPSLFPRAAHRIRGQVCIAAECDARKNFSPAISKSNMRRYAL